VRPIGFAPFRLITTIRAQSVLGGEIMRIREMSVWYKLSIVAAALVGGVVTRYATLVIMAGVISELSKVGFFSAGKYR